MKNKILKIGGSISLILLFAFTLVFTTTSSGSIETEKAQASECRWTIYDGFIFCGYESAPLHCNCGDLIS